MRDCLGLKLVLDDGAPCGWYWKWGIPDLPMSRPVSARRLRAWHWLHKDMTTNYADHLGGQLGENPWAIGEERVIPLGLPGYFSTFSPWHAFTYHGGAHGRILCLVEISEPEWIDGIQQISRLRKVLEARDLLHQKGRWQAGYFSGSEPTEFNAYIKQFFERSS